MVGSKRSFEIIKKCHLHEIKNLSEKFIYFNDDITFFNPMCPEDYFEDENYKVYLNGKASGYPSGRDQGYSYEIIVILLKIMASTGIEPATFALLARRSNQLS